MVGWVGGGVGGGGGWFFFFSSRRRHTRYWRDWSSDVCSSDLGLKNCFLFSRSVYTHRTHLIYFHEAKIIFFLHNSWHCCLGKINANHLIHKGWARKTWKNQVEDEIKKIGLKKEDALNRSKWRKGVN